MGVGGKSLEGGRVWLYFIVYEEKNDLTFLFFFLRIELHFCTIFTDNIFCILKGISISKSFNNMLIFSPPYIIYFTF